MGLFEIRTLENLPLSDVHGAFVEVFSDCEAPMQMSVVELEEMLRMRDIDQGHSIGCFLRKELIGFILCGYRDCEDKKYAYDGGTGIIEEYRRRGLSNRMFDEVLKILSIKDIDMFILEVLENNAPAIEFYHKKGFVIDRKLRCFEINKEDIESAIDLNYTFNNSKSEFYEINLNDFFRFRPAWQNSKLSILNNIHMYEYVSIYIDTELVGFGFIHKNKGDIPLLGMLERWENRGVESLLINELKKKTKSDIVKFINVLDDSYLIDILIKMGFSNFANQYEMVLKLKEG